MFPSNFNGQFFGEKGVTDVLYSIEVLDGFPEVPNKDMIGLKKVKKNLMIDIGCSASSWRQAGLCGAALGIMPLDGRRGGNRKERRIANSAQTEYCTTFPCVCVSHRRDISDFLDNLIV